MSHSPWRRAAAGDTDGGGDLIWLPPFRFQRPGDSAAHRGDIEVAVLNLNRLNQPDQAEFPFAGWPAGDGAP